VRRWRDDGRLLLLLDGLDEVPEGQRPAVREEIAAFARSPHGQRCRILVSSRLAGYTALGGGFWEYILKPFQKPEEVGPYLKGWLAALRPEGKERAEEEADRLLAKMQARPALRRVLDNPLLLRLAAEVYARTGQIARNRSELYEKWVEETWRRAEARGARREPMPWPGWRRSPGGCTMAGSWTSTKGISPCWARRWAGWRGWTRDGWASPTGPFRNISCFVARRLRRAWAENRPGAWAFLRPRLHLPEWREPLLLLAGMLGPSDADDLIRRVENARSPYEGYLRRDLLLALRLWGEAAQAPPDQGEALMRKALTDENKRVRRAAAEALGEIQRPEALPHLLQALTDENGKVRWAAAVALGKCLGGIPTAGEAQERKEYAKLVRQAARDLYRPGAAPMRMSPSPSPWIR